MESESLDATGVRSLEPGLTSSGVGGVFFPNECEVEPYGLVSALAELAQQRGVEMFEDPEVVDLEMMANRVTALRTTVGPMSTDDYVVSAGAWSRKLVEKVVGWVPIEPAKGYSITTSAPHRSPHLPF